MWRLCYWFIGQKYWKKYGWKTEPFIPVGIVTKLRVWRSGVWIPVWGKWFPSSPKSRTDRIWGPPSLQLNGYRGYFPEAKKSGLEVYHWPSSTDEVNKGWILTSTPTTHHHGLDRHNFIFFKTNFCRLFSAIHLIHLIYLSSYLKDNTSSVMSCHD
jgi:hypothetical protein